MLRAFATVALWVALPALGQTFVAADIDPAPVRAYPFFFIPHQETEAQSDASTPNGAVSLAEAISKQMGLRLVKEKRMLPVSVIDYIEQKPTGN